MILKHFIKQKIKKGGLEETPSNTKTRNIATLDRR